MVQGGAALGVAGRDVRGERDAAELHRLVIGDDAIDGYRRERARPALCTVSTAASRRLAIIRAPDCFFSSANPPQ